MKSILHLAKRHIIPSSLVAIVCLILASVVVGYARLTSFEANYENLRIGESKEFVVDHLGQPMEIHSCGQAEDATSIGPCFEEYWYYFFMERWIIYLDKNGSVTDKSYAVSY